MSEALNILLIEDDEDDYVLAREVLAEAFPGRLKLDWIDNWDAGLAAIREARHDVYLVDYRLGERDGVALVREAIEGGCKAPIILLTGLESREIDIQAMEAGAADYLVKDQISAPLLDRAIRYAMDRKRVEGSLSSLAQYDPLTGLANRSLFHLRLNDAIAQAKRAGHLVAVMLLDLDHFKDINDSWGHPVGDALLKSVADRLVSNTRETDTVSRLGGDEFAIIATNLADPEGAATLAHKAIKAISEPFILDGQEVRTATSIGISLYPMDKTDPEKLLKHADFALYQAKGAGRGTFQFYDAEMNARRRARKTLEAELGLALERRELSLHYQPKVHAITGAVTGVEALLRWAHPERGAIPPTEFIPIAEASGQIVEIGRWVMETACAEHFVWRQAGLPPISMAVNLSGIQLRRPDLVDTVAKVVADTGIEPQHLEFEITEGTIIDKQGSVIKVLHALRGRGHKLSIDDFGTGYSSLVHLKQFPVDSLKIDRSFVANIPDSPDDVAITRAVIALAQSLNLRTVAEGVENWAQFTCLQEWDCRELQGYYFCRPVPSEQFVAWFQKRKKSLSSVA